MDQMVKVDTVMCTMYTMKYLIITNSLRFINLNSLAITQWTILENGNDKWLNIFWSDINSMNIFAFVLSFPITELVCSSGAETLLDCQPCLGAEAY